MPLPQDFFLQDALDCAPQLLGKRLVRQFGSQEQWGGIITEVEVYRGEEDLACHASKGRTKRTEIMYAQGGVVYVYLIYGMYWLLNVVTGPLEHPQAILIRGLHNVTGPGRIGKILRLDSSFYGENMLTSSRLWIEDQAIIKKKKIVKSRRIGIDYAQEWAKKLWRFELILE